MPRESAVSPALPGSPAAGRSGACRRPRPGPVLAAILAAALAAAGCAMLRQESPLKTLRGTITLDRRERPPVVLLADSEKKTWQLEGRAADDLRELDRAVVEVSGIADPPGPRPEREAERFRVLSYRLVEVAGRPAMVGTLAWEGPDLMLVHLDGADRVPLAGPALGRLPALMGKTIWVAGEPRRGAFVVERYGVLDEAP